VALVSTSRRVAECTMRNCWFVVLVSAWICNSVGDLIVSRPAVSWLLCHPMSARHAFHT
jgi:hypothetical protein